MHKLMRFCEPEALFADLATVAETRRALGAPERVTRQDHALFVPRSKTETGKRRFRCRGPALYNALPPELLELPVPTFTRRLRQRLSARPPD